MHAISILAFLLPLVAAHGHKQCDCMTWADGQDWGHNEILTHFVCVEDYNHRVCTKSCKFQLVSCANEKEDVLTRFSHFLSQKKRPFTTTPQNV